MLIALARYTLLLFGIFLICVGLLMLTKPAKARAIIAQAGSTNFINYAEITLRMIPAAAFIVYASESKFPQAFSLLGWTMIITSLILYFVPRKLHHAYALRCAEVLRPGLLRLIAPISIFFGLAVVYGIC